jgi:hypothetical protein
MMEDLDNTSEGLMGGLQLMSMVNTLKTGNMIIDMALAMLLPLVLRYIFSFDITCYSEWLQKLWSRQVTQYERFITYRAQKTSWGDSTSLDKDTQNTILQKAIQLYLHHHGCLKYLKSANLDLTTMEDKKSSLDDYVDMLESDEEDENDTSKTLVGMLSKYSIVKKPLNNEWHDIGVHGGDLVQLCISEDQRENGGKENETRCTLTTTFHFVSSGANSIDTFIETAHAWYMNELRSLEDHSRYYYEIKSTSQKLGDDEENGILYSRYKLSEEKTFGSLFFRQKENILSMIDHFQAKTGRYAIAGYPHKLGFLLHGPPGTGKTSLIKAMAQYTGRSIVNVPLSRISTNAELMDIFFRHQYNIENCSVPVKLGFKDVIFVMEDVDAASKVVRRRDGKLLGPRPETIEIPIKSPWQLMIESTSDDCKELVQELMEQSDRLKEAAIQSDVLCSFASRMGAASTFHWTPPTDEAPFKIAQEVADTLTQINSGMDAVDDFLGRQCRAIKVLLDSGAEVDDAFVDGLLNVSLAADASNSVFVNQFPPEISCDEDGCASMSGNARLETALLGKDTLSDHPLQGAMFSRSVKDKLNLTGLLNVLDGVIDTPGRILIMTSNHPELLDPALIRPGRIDKKIMLGHMHPADIISMVSHYFQTELNTQQKNQIQNLRTTFTPAVVEQLTAEHESVDEMIAALARRSATGGTVVTSTSSFCSFE